MRKIPLLIDVDTGIDDAVAIICATQYQEKYEITAITTVSGNVELKYTSSNTLNLLNYIEEKNIKVALGATQPLKKEPIYAISHGDTGLADIELPESQEKFYEKNAVDTIYEMACKYDGELIVLATGPETNMASALNKYPDLANKIKHIYIMGGALNCGNMTQVSEFNSYVDPEAFKTVVHSKLPITMVGLDITLKLHWTKEVLEKIRNINTKKSSIVTRIMEFTERNSKAKGIDEANMHDVAAFALIVAPEIFEYQNYYMDVETEGTLTRGMTVVDYVNVTKNPHNVKYAIKLDLEKFWNWFINTLRK